MKVSELESTPVSCFDFDDADALKEAVNEHREALEAMPSFKPPRAATPEARYAPLARRPYQAQPHRPIAPTLIDEDLSGFQAHSDYECAPASVPRRSLRTLLPPPPQAVYARATPSGPPPPPSYPPEPMAGPQWSVETEASACWSSPPSAPPTWSSPPSVPPRWSSPPSAPPTWSSTQVMTVTVDSIDPVLASRGSITRQLTAPLLFIAAGLMAASLWLSASDRTTAHRVGSSRVSATSCEAPPEEAVLESNPLTSSAARPAPTLATPPRHVDPLPPAVARRVDPAPPPVAKHVDPAPPPAATAPPAEEPLAQNTPAAALGPASAPPAHTPSAGLDQANHTARMLRDQLNSSIR